MTDKNGKEINVGDKVRYHVISATKDKYVSAEIILIYKDRTAILQADDGYTNSAGSNRIEKIK